MQKKTIRAAFFASLLTIPAVSIASTQIHDRNHPADEGPSLRPRLRFRTLRSTMTHSVHRKTKGAHTLRHSALYPAIVVLSVAVAGCGAGGKVADAPALSQANTAVQRLSHGTAMVSKVFPGPGGLEGLVIHPAHPANLPAGAPKGQIGWITRDGETLVMGTVIGTNGTNYTERAMRAEGLLPKAISARMLARKAQRADGFVVGSKGLHPAKGPEIIAFVDPN